MSCRGVANNRRWHQQDPLLRSALSANPHVCELPGDSCRRRDWRTLRVPARVLSETAGLTDSTANDARVLWMKLCLATPRCPTVASHQVRVRMDRKSSSHMEPGLSAQSTRSHSAPDLFVNDGSPQPGNRAVARLPRAPRSGRELFAGPTGTRKERKPPSVPQRQRQRRRRRTPRPGDQPCGQRATSPKQPQTPQADAPSSSPKQPQCAGMVEDGWMTLTSCIRTMLPVLLRF